MTMSDNEFQIGDLASLAEMHDADPVKQAELDDAQQTDRQHLRNVDSITQTIDQRLNDASGLNRESWKKKGDIEDRLETVEEMQEDTAVYEQYIREDPDARRYIDNLLALVDLYQEQVDNLVPANMILYPTVEQLAEMLDEQQLRHDESFVLQRTTEVVENMKQSFQDTMQSVQQSHETTNEELLNRFDRMLDRYATVSENQVQMQESMTEMVALLQEFASDVDTARSQRIEQKLDRIEDRLDTGEDGE